VKHYLIDQIPKERKMTAIDSAGWLCELPLEMKCALDDTCQLTNLLLYAHQKSQLSAFF
jgi:hypothetical protein